MLLDKTKELVLRSEYSEALDLLAELKEISTITLLDELEITALQYIVQRRLRNYSNVVNYTEPLKKLYAKITQQYPEIKEILSNLNDFAKETIIPISFKESILNLSLIVQEKLPVLLFVEIQFFVEGQWAFYFPFSHVDLLKISSIFLERNDHIFYSELLLLTTWSYLYRWENKIALDLANEYLRICKEKDDYYGITVSYVTIASIYADMGNCREAIDYSYEYLKHAKKLGIINIIWHAYFALALHHAYADDIKTAIRYDNKCSELEQQPDFTDRFTASRQLITIHINLKKGEINLALEQILEVLEKNEKIMSPYSLAMAYEVIADIYSQKNDYKLALKYYRKGLETRDKFGGYTIVANNYFHIFEIILQLGLKEQALEYLDKLRKLKEDTDEILVNNLYSFSEALYLKSRNDKENRTKAKNILIDLISTETPYHKTADRSYLHLCDLILDEIKTTENMALIQTLHNHIKELTLKATIANSNLLLIELYFLQSKILLLDLKVEEAINLLEQALALARDKGLKRLEILLSDEYDLLLQQIDAWEDFSSYLPTLDERLELTHIEDLLKRMMRKWVSYGAITPENESPQYLVIMNEEGTNIFTEVFPYSVFESEELAEAMNKIMQLKNKLEPNRDLLRFRYRQYSCLLTEDQNLLLCYIFMGKSYIPMSKLRKLKEILGRTSLLQKVKETWIESRKIDIDSRIQISKLIEEIFRSF